MEANGDNLLNCIFNLGRGRMHYDYLLTRIIYPLGDAYFDSTLNQTVVRIVTVELKEREAAEGQNSSINSRL